MGWDAAWTPNGTGAWAVAVAGKVELHEVTPCGDGLLTRLDEVLLEYRPAVIAMDLPLAVGGVRGWRTADLETTRAFSRFGCPVHSPTAERPGAWGDRIVEVLSKRGCHLALSKSFRESVYAEVYPHTVLLDIYRRARRLPYKAGRSKQYWPDLGREERVERLLQTYREIWGRLAESWRLPSFPGMSDSPRMKDVKMLEDLTDALVCLEAAGGIQTGRYRPYGDETAAIWNPDAAVLLRRTTDEGGGTTDSDAGQRML